MLDIKNAKIYKIVDNTSDLVYIGSTQKEHLKQRLSQHKSDYHKYKKGGYRFVSAYQIFDNGDFDICLLENCIVNNLHELKLRERFYIESIKCVNMNIPSRTSSEWHKGYYAKDKETFKAKAKTNYDNNQDRIIKYRSEIINCPCGRNCTRGNILQHKKSLVHQKWANQN